MSELGTALEGLSTVDGASYIDDGGNGYDDDYEHGDGLGNDFGHGIEHACRQVLHILIIGDLTSVSYCGIHNPQCVVKVNTMRTHVHVLTFSVFTARNGSATRGAILPHRISSLI